MHVQTANPPEASRTARTSARPELRTETRDSYSIGPRERSLAPSSSLLSSGTAWALLDFLFVWMLASLVMVQPYENLRSIAISAYSNAPLPFAVLVLLCSRLSGLHEMESDRPALIELVLSLQSCGLSGLGIYGLERLWRLHAQAGLFMWVGFLAGLGLFLSRLLWRRRRKRLCQQNIVLRNFLVVGADRIGQDVRQYLASLPHQGYRFTGFVAMNEPSDDSSAVNADEIVGEIEDTAVIAQSRFVDEIIFSHRPATPGLLSRILREVRSIGIAVRLIPGVAETLVDRTDIEYVGNLPTVLVFQPKRRASALSAKRVVDIVGAGAAAVLLLPVFAAIALAIKLDSPGPTFYLSKRIGHKGRVFICFKFRTMVHNAESMQEQMAHLNEREGILFKISRDPRMTRVGATLRKYSLDELPQIWNVLRGDMSLVGPRPSIASEVAQYGAADLRRLDALPGITGLWQVEARQDPSFGKYISLDRRYVNEWSLWLDLRIMFRTIWAVIGGTGS